MDNNQADTKNSSRCRNQILEGQVSREEGDKATKFNVADPGQVSREALTF